MARIPRRLARIWASISPPRRITLTMLAAYLLCGVQAARDLLHGALLPPPATLIGAVCVAAGAILAIPTAWRGMWMVEAPAAGLITVGLAVEAAEEILLAPNGHLPLYTLLVLVLMLTRIERIWGRDWEPGREPPATVDESEEAVRRAQEAERRAVEAAIVRGDAAWTAD
ncbi:hypothetical protein [Actinomyces procaprae]|uniref:hypothetical protein n=1 Tax=Actinomyces procaprae TaxID=2560010 RepID=UPI0010A245AE|nr:hypothetical protein [Actinomyces procaprae]